MANLEQKGQVGPKTGQNFNKKVKVELKMSKLSYPQKVASPAVWTGGPLIQIQPGGPFIHEDCVFLVVR